MNSNVDKNQINWEDIYSLKKPGNYMNYPSEHLVSLFFQNRAAIRCDGTCLDYGFGSGNNTEFLIQRMKQIYGLEIATSSLDIIDQRLRHYDNYQPDHFKVSNDETPFPGGFFDLIVAWQVLCYNDHDSLVSAIAKLDRYLNRDGILICTLTKQNDVKVQLSEPIAKNTYRVDQRIPHQAGCVVYSPENQSEFLALFSAFRVIDYGYYERSSLVHENTAAEYYLVAAKK